MVFRNDTKEVHKVLSAADRLWSILLISATGVHATIALELWTTRDPTFPTPSQTFLYSIFPDEVWPLIFLLCSISAFFGLWNLRMAQLHFILAGSLMGTWSAIALQMPTSPVIRVGGLLLLHLSLLKFSLAYYTPKLQKAHTTAVKVIEEVGLVQEQLANEDFEGGK
jgi:hypothetical protein